MKTVAIVQARTTSSRLPRKALLPIQGYPTAALCALRARNRGGKVCVATSSDASDDELASKLEQYEIPVFRGPLQDVLRRYALATAELPDDCIVVRLTADNVVPDESLVQDLAHTLANSGLEYLAEVSPESRLPYGVGGEAFTVGTLRKADREAISAYDREHVGPWMKRNGRSGALVPPWTAGKDFSHLRCTIDDEEDYERVVRLFSGVDDPLHVGARELVERLAELPGEPAFRVPYRMRGGLIESEMTLGSVQLGMEYGIANRSGMPSRSSAVTIVREAIAHGVTTIDTARSYGEAEQVVGAALEGAWASRVRVITKLDSLTSVSSDADLPTVRACVDQSLEQSRAALRTEILDTVLLHRSHHREAWDGAGWRRLLEWKEQGRIRVLGASVYEPHEALRLLRDPDVGHLQVPMNVLDWRWRGRAMREAMETRTDVLVHARSALLQGLVATTADHWPIIGDFDAASCLERLQFFTRSFGRRNVPDLCLAYVRALPWVSSVVVGCETLAQLQEDMDLFRLPELTHDQCEELEQGLPTAPENLLNPAQWSMHDGRRALEKR